MIRKRDLDLVTRIQMLHIAGETHRLGDNPRQLVYGVRRIRSHVENLIQCRRRFGRRAMTGATSSICVNARSWVPSPKIVIGSPRSS